MCRFGKVLFKVFNKNRDNFFVKRYKLELSRIDKFSFLRFNRSMDKVKIIMIV